MGDAGRFNLTYGLQYIHQLGCSAERVLVVILTINNISYSDDMSLISALVCGPKKLVVIFDNYAELHDHSIHFTHSIARIHFLNLDIT